MRAFTESVASFEPPELPESNPNPALHAPATHLPIFTIQPATQAVALHPSQRYVLHSTNSRTARPEDSPFATAANMPQMSTYMTSTLAPTTVHRSSTRRPQPHALDATLTKNIIMNLINHRRSQSYTPLRLIHQTDLDHYR